MCLGGDAAFGCGVRGSSSPLTGPPSAAARGLPSVSASLILKAAWQVLGLRGSRIRVWMWR